jgi:hypothetical protein
MRESDEEKKEPGSDKSRKGAGVDKTLQVGWIKLNKSGQGGKM